MHLTRRRYYEGHGQLIISAALAGFTESWTNSKYVCLILNSSHVATLQHQSRYPGIAKRRRRTTVCKHCRLRGPFPASQALTMICSLCSASCRHVRSLFTNTSKRSNKGKTSRPLNLWRRLPQTKVFDRPTSTTRSSPYCKIDCRQEVSFRQVAHHAALDCDIHRSRPSGSQRRQLAHTPQRKRLRPHPWSWRNQRGSPLPRRGIPPSLTSAKSRLTSLQ